VTDPRSDGGHDTLEASPGRTQRRHVMFEPLEVPEPQPPEGDDDDVIVDDGLD
jgi:hypothetical protein